MDFVVGFISPHAEISMYYTQDRIEPEHSNLSSDLGTDSKLRLIENEASNMKGKLNTLSYDSLRTVAQTFPRRFGFSACSKLNILLQIHLILFSLTLSTSELLCFFCRSLLSSCLGPRQKPSDSQLATKFLLGMWGLLCEHCTYSQWWGIWNETDFTLLCKVGPLPH